MSSNTYSHTCFLFSKYLQVPKSDFQLGEENLQNGAPPTHAAGASKKSFPHIKMFVNFCAVNISPMIFGIWWLATQCSSTLQNQQCCPNTLLKKKTISSVVTNCGRFLTWFFVLFVELIFSRWNFSCRMIVSWKWRWIIFDL